MNFNQQQLQAVGHGTYTRMDPSLLPPLYLAYNTRNGGESGKVHSPVLMT